MPNQTASFICEIEVETTDSDRACLNKRFDAGRQAYNALKGEAMRRARNMFEGEAYQKAKSLPQLIKDPITGKKRPNPERTALFKQARKDYDFSDYALQSYATQLSHSWLGEHIDSSTMQKIATRAFRAVNDFVVGKRGAPRFKSKNRMHSVEGKSNLSGIRLKENSLLWSGLVLPLLIDFDDPLHSHGLHSRVKYVRLVRREIRGQQRFFAQLVCEGRPFQKPKNQTNPGVVGLDIGPSTLAIVSKAPDPTASLERFADELDDKSKTIASLQRKVERQRRAANPHKYAPSQWKKNPNGNWKHKKGKILPKDKKQWTVSKRMAANQSKLRDKHRKLAAHRKSLHGKMVNEILKLGTTIQTEKLSYKAFQRRFGRSVSKRAPGSFVWQLRRKAENAGGSMVEFNTRTTRLSQVCLCEAIVKKPLSQRWHCCPCGIVQQRDLLSALLACYVEDNLLAVRVARKDYTTIDCVLRTTASNSKSVIGQGLPALPKDSCLGSEQIVRLVPNCPVRPLE